MTDNIKLSGLLVESAERCWILRTSYKNDVTAIAFTRLYESLANTFDMVLSYKKSAVSNLCEINQTVGQETVHFAHWTNITAHFVKEIISHAIMYLRVDGLFSINYMELRENTYV